MTKRRNEFQLQFAPTRIRELAPNYIYQGDADALQAGQRIARGDYSRANVEAIFNGRRVVEASRVYAVTRMLKSGMGCDSLQALRPSGLRFQFSVDFAASTSRWHPQF